MNTLKLKVLLILTNAHLWRSVRRSFLIWFFTAVTGCTIVHIIFSQSLIMEAYGMSLLCSSPAIFIAIPVLYFIPRFQSRFMRIGFALCSILATCAAIIGIIAVLSGGVGFVFLALSPFVPSAILWFFLIAGAQTLHPYYC